MSRVRWENMRKAFQALPGTRRPRTLLALWEFGLWGLVSAGPMIGLGVLWWATWREWLGLGIVWAVGSVGAGVVAFFCHELFFCLYAERVAKAIEFEDSWDADQRQQPSYVPTLERWTGPVR